MAMFRLGSFLCIPAYLTVILYRVFASSTDDGNFFLMTGKSPHQLSVHYPKSHSHLTFPALAVST